MTRRVISVEPYTEAQLLTRNETSGSFAHISEVAPFFEIDPHWSHAVRACQISPAASSNAH